MTDLRPGDAGACGTMGGMDEPREDRAERPGSRSGGLLRNVLLLVLFTSSGRVLSLLPLDAFADTPTARLLTAGDTIAAATWLGLGLLAAALAVWAVQRARDDA